MWPIGFALGAITGAAAVLIAGRQGAQRVRPVAKAVLKAALVAFHEARVHGAEVAEAAEDLYAEAKAELTAEALAAAVAAAQARAPAQKAAESKEQQPAGSETMPQAAGDSVR